jgi:hypothetical protein
MASGGVSGGVGTSHLTSVVNPLNVGSVWELQACVRKPSPSMGR